MMCFTMHNFTVTIHSAEAEFDSVKESLTISKYYSSAQSKLHYQKCNHHSWLSINLVPYLFSTDKYAHSATSFMRIREHGRLGLIKSSICTYFNWMHRLIMLSQSLFWYQRRDCYSTILHKIQFHQGLRLVQKSSSNNVVPADILQKHNRVGHCQVAKIQSDTCALHCTWF